MGGELVFAGTRVEVKTLVDYLKAGHPLGGFLDDFRTVGRGQAVAYLEIATRAMEESLLLHEAQDGAEREAVARSMEKKYWPVEAWRRWPSSSTGRTRAISR